jgi:hypothetical protein
MREKKTGEGVSSGNRKLWSTAEKLRIVLAAWSRG